MNDLQPQDQPGVAIPTPGDAGPKLKLRSDDQIGEQIKDNRPKCPKCDRMVSEGDKICGSCGLNLKTGRSVHQEAARRKTQGNIIKFAIAVAIIGAGGYFAHKNWDKIKPWFDKVKKEATDQLDKAGVLDNDTAEDQLGIAGVELPAEVREQIEEIQYEIEDLKQEVAGMEEEYNNAKTTYTAAKDEYKKAVVAAKKKYYFYKFKGKDQVHRLEPGQDKPKGAVLSKKKRTDEDLIDKAVEMKDELDGAQQDFKYYHDEKSALDKKVKALEKKKEGLIAPYKKDETPEDTAE